MAGNPIIHLILLFTTFGIGNIVYYLWARGEGEYQSPEEAIRGSGVRDESVIHDTRSVVIMRPLKSPATRYIVTDHRVVLKKGTLNKRSVEQQVDNIRQISTGATWLERLQGIGHINLEAHDGAVIRFKSISNYGTVADTIRRLQSSR